MVHISRSNCPGFRLQLQKSRISLKLPLLVGFYKFKRIMCSDSLTPHIYEVMSAVPPLHEVYIGSKSPCTIEAYSHAAGQQTARLLRNLEVSLSCSKVTSPEPVNPIHTLKSHLFKIEFNIIFTTTLTYPMWFYPAGFCDLNFYGFFISGIFATCSTHLMFLELNTPYIAEGKTL